MARPRLGGRRSPHGFGGGGQIGGDRLGMEGRCIRENGGMAGATCGGGLTLQASGWMVLGSGISLWPSDLSTPDGAMGGY